MKPNRNRVTFKSFADLKAAFSHGSRNGIRREREKPEPGEDLPSGETCERKLFKAAMANVTPLKNHKRIVPDAPSLNLPESGADNEEAVLMRLRALIESGRGFVVADTPEYMEGRDFNTHPEVMKRLHRGDFSIEDHIDLHGCTVPEARERFDHFLDQAIRHAKRAVLIVHGRGLCSPHEPVLKGRIREWLSTGYWRKWVIAFASARGCDGGAGATYVLLRRRPMTKRYRRAQSKGAFSCSSHG